MGNFKAAVRSLLSTPGPTAVVILTLAIAIGANTAIFSVIDGVLLSPLGYVEEDRLVVPWNTRLSEGDEGFKLSAAGYRDLREEVDAFGGEVGLYRFIGSTLTGLDRPVRVGSLTMTPRLFATLGVVPAAGQLFAEADETPGGPKKLVLTYTSWTRRFGGDPEIVGSTIDLDSEPYTVVGITEEGFQFPPGDDQVEVYFPMTLTDQVLLDRDHRMFDALARLDDGVSLQAARDELDALAARLRREFPDSNEGWGMTARPLREEILGDLGTTLWVLSGAVFLVLLIACANIANVLVARSSAASREYAVRAALGARRADLYRRSLTESLILGVVGGGLGLALAFWGTAVLRTVIPADIPRGSAVGIDGTVLFFTAVLSLGAGALFGALPALRSMTPDLADLLKPAGATGSRGMGGRRLREAMVVVEVALAIVLLVGAGLMLRSFVRLSAVDPGFRQQDVVAVAIQLPSSRHDRSEWLPFYEQLVERVQALPGVEAAGAVSDLPMSTVGLDFDMEFTVIDQEDAPTSVSPNADFRLVIPGYFEAMDMRVIAGRDFDALDPTSDRPVAIVNETLAARYLQGVNPLDQTLRVPMMGDVAIVGVVRDIRHGGLQSKYESEIFIPYGRIATAQLHIVAHSRLDSGAVARGIGDIVNDMDPELAPTEVAAIDELLWQSVARPRFNTALLTGLALCAAILAIVGTYGIVAYSVTRRTGEIGVRMALGANSNATVWMIVRQALGVVLVGAAAGLLAALGMSRLLAQLLFGVRPTDPLTYVVVLTAAVVVGCLAAWIPARRATRVDPVAALRDA